MVLHFGPFRLDTVNGQLWRDSEALRPRSKLLAVLQFLALNPQRLVRHDEILDAVWESSAVSESVLRGYIRDLRRLLGDAASGPRYIETVSGRGYRFVAEVTREGDVAFREPSSGITRVDAPGRDVVPGLVGREPELQALDEWLSQMLAGKRQVVFITGDAGIGKTALLEAFLERASSDHSMLVARGQCLEGLGTGEAYLPLLDALGRLGRSASSRHVIDTLERHAPTWLVQLPALVGPPRLEALKRSVAGATRGRMLRELAEGLEVLSRKRPLVLALDDLQWSDDSTTELLPLIAGRHERARLLVIGTYRRAELGSSGHPLKRVAGELKLHDEAKEIALHALSPCDVSRYLALRFGEHEFPEALAPTVHRTTDGNPLFMLALIDDLLNQRMLRRVDGRWRLGVELADVGARTPESLQELIDDTIERMPEFEQSVIEAASIAASDFSAGSVAAALERDPEQVELTCEALARQKRLLRHAGVDRSGGSMARPTYRFVHTLYRRVAQLRGPRSRQAVWHGRIGRYLEAGAAERTELAPELALHFEESGDAPRAVQYHLLAGERAAGCFAGLDALRHFRRALALIRELPASRERDAQELSILTAIEPLLIATQGFSSQEVRPLSMRALELTRELGQPLRTFAVLAGVHLRALMLAEYERASELGLELESIARSQDDPDLLGRAITARASPLLCVGRLSECRELLQQALELYDPERRSVNGFDPSNVGVAASVQFASIEWLTGHPERALKAARYSLEMAEATANPWARVNALMCMARTHRLRREPGPALEYAERALAIAKGNEFRYWRSEATTFWAWCKVMRGSREHLPDLHTSLRERLATTVIGVTGLLSTVAEACLAAGDVQAGLSATDEALGFVHSHGEITWHADVLRLRADLLLENAARAAPVQREAARAEAEACALEACERARILGTKIHELRARSTLCRIGVAGGRGAEAKQALLDVYRSFSEGFELPDWREAHTLLGGALLEGAANAGG